MNHFRVVVLNTSCHEVPRKAGSPIHNLCGSRYGASLQFAFSLNRSVDDAVALVLYLTPEHLNIKEHTVCMHVLSGLHLCFQPFMANEADFEAGRPQSANTHL